MIPRNRSPSTSFSTYHPTPSFAYHALPRTLLLTPMVHSTNPNPNPHRAKYRDKWGSFASTHMIETWNMSC